MLAYVDVTSALALAHSTRAQLKFALHCTRTQSSLYNSELPASDVLVFIASRLYGTFDWDG